jgi:CHASE2 domain-containing sensor protein
VSGPTDLEGRLAEYLAARESANRFVLVGKRRTLLPPLRQAAATLQGLRALRGAVAVLEDLRDSGVAEPEPVDLVLLATLRERLAGLKPDSCRLPLLLLDATAGEAVVAELVVEVLSRPGGGRLVGPPGASADTDGAALRAVTAASVWLQRKGYEANPGDLEISWQVVGQGGSIEGASASLGLALALLGRALGRPIPPGWAATGDLALDGAVEAVAGVPAKLAAAASAGIAQVLVPLGSPSAAGTRSVPVANLDEAAAHLFGLRRRIPPLAPVVAGALALAALAFGVLDVAGLLAYPWTHVPLSESALSDRVVLVAWGEDDALPSQSPTALGDQAVPAVDFGTFLDHKSYRATHPVVLRRLAAAGVKVVALDVWIRGGESASRADIAHALWDAQDSGATVLLPARRVNSRWAMPAEELPGERGFAEMIAERPGRLVRSAPLGERGVEGPPWSIVALAVAAQAGGIPAWDGPDRVRLAGRTVSAREGRLWFRFPKRPGFRRYRYADIYDGNFDPDHLRGAIVVLGGVLGDQDRHRTPVGRWHGMEISAAAQSALIGGHTLEPLDRRGRALLLLLVPLAALWKPRWRAARWLGAGGVLVLACFLVARLAFGAGVFWPPTDLALPLAALCVVRALAARRGRTAPGLKG